MVGDRTFLEHAAAALCAAVVVFGGHPAASAQTPPTPVVHGSQQAPVRDLIRDLGSVLTTSDDSAAVAAVTSWYAARGFLYVSVDSIVHRPGAVDVWLREGLPSVIDTLRWTGLTADELSDVRARIESREGGPFIPSVLDNDLRTVVALLESRGRLLATVRVASIVERERDDAEGTTVDVDVAPGPELLLGEITFEGNTETRPATLLRATGLEPGSLWLPTSGERARRRLLRTQLFTAVDPPALALSADRRIRVTYRVTEGRNNSFDGIAGYQPPGAGDASGTFTGLADIQLRNLFGTARRFGLRWFQERRGTQEVEVAYREPWLPWVPVGAGLRFFQRKQDSTFVRQDVELDLSGEASEDMMVGLTYQSWSTIPQSGYGQRVLTGSTTTLLGVRFTYDARDDQLTPRRGSLFGTEYQSGRKSGPAGGATQQLKFDLEGYVPLGDRQVLAAAAHGRDIRSGTLDAADLVRLGGATTLRGYREGEFLAARLARGTVEWRAFLAPRSYAALFVDAAVFSHPSIVGLAATGDITRVGYGLAVRVDAPVGLIGVSIALGKNDGIGDAKLHVRLQNEF